MGAGAFLDFDFLLEAAALRRVRRLPQVPAAGFGVDGGEEFIFDVGAGAGEGIEEGGFAGVGVANERDGEVLAFAFPDLAGFSGLDVDDAVFEVGDFVADESAVDFKLHFAGAAGPHAGPCSCSATGTAGDAFQVAPHVAEARVGVLELGEGDLELGFVGAGAGGENVEDEFGAVEDFAVDDFFEVAQLVGGHVVVEDDDVGVELVGELVEFLGFAFADVGAGVDVFAVLDDLGDDLGAGGMGEAGEFAEGIARIGGGTGKVDTDEDGFFGTDGELGAGVLVGQESSFVGAWGWEGEYSRGWGEK